MYSCTNQPKPTEPRDDQRRSRMSTNLEYKSTFTCIQARQNIQKQRKHGYSTTVTNCKSSGSWSDTFLTLHRIRSKLFLKILLAPLFLRTIQISSALHTLGSCTHRCATYNQRTMVINHHRIGLALGPSIIPRCELLHTPEIRILLVLSPRIIRMRDVKKKLQKLQN